MSTLSVTIERGSLSLPDLVIGLPTYGSPLWLPEDGVTEPAWAFRGTYAPDSAYVPGKQLLAAVLDQSSLPLVVWARAIGETSLAVAKATLEAAVSQFTYDVMVDIDGAARTFQADPCWPQWGAVDSGQTAAGVAWAQVNIPVNPPGAD